MGEQQGMMHGTVSPCSNKDPIIGLPPEVALYFEAHWSIIQAGGYIFNNLKFYKVSSIYSAQVGWNIGTANRGL